MDITLEAIIALLTLITTLLEAILILWKCTIQHHQKAHRHEDMQFT